MTLVSAAMRDRLGAQVGYQVSHPISSSDIRRWAIAVYWPDPPPACFVSDEPVLAPEEFNPFAWSCAKRTPPRAGSAPDADPGSLERSLGVAGPAVDHVLNGGREATYGVRMRSGDVITSVQTLHDYEERESRLGPMLITRLREDWSNGGGDLVMTQVMTILRY